MGGAALVAFHGQLAAPALRVSEEWLAQQDLRAVGAVGAPSAVGLSLAPETVMNLGV
jgi:hypothetical protein